MNNLANESVYQLQYYKKSFLKIKIINRTFLIILSLKANWLIVSHVYFHLKF